MFPEMNMGRGIRVRQRLLREINTAAFTLRNRFVSLLHSRHALVRRVLNVRAYRMTPGAEGNHGGTRRDR
jgi:hypothetical protein